MQGGLSYSSGPIAAGAPLAPSYTANPVNGDGTNDYLVRGADFTGSADSPNWTGSLWIRRTGGTGTLQRIIASGGGNDLVEWTTGDVFRIRGTTVLDLQTTSAITDTNWRHIMWSVNATAHHLYVNDATDMSVVAHTATDLDFTQNNWSVFAQVNGNTKFSGDMADLQMWFGTYVDLSQTANRRLFITADGKPVDPATAVASLGSPIVLLSGETTSWHTNDGTGGGFTLNGSLTDGTGPVGA